MFSGTLVSRLLGMIRSPLLLGAAIGANLGASDAFAVANKLPTVVYLLIAGGVLNAILVPALVRAMTRDDDGGQTYANRLITVFGVGLAAITLLLTVASQALVYLYAGAMPKEWFDIAVAFAYWTVPQLFFYGMYTMLGQVLNARGIFGPYMWAPALNNVVAIAGLCLYLWVYGTADASGAGDPAAWTPARIALLAGTATLGIVAQAVILVVPLKRSGFRYRFDFQIRGSGLGRASRTAMWVFAAVLVGQVSNILVSQAAAGARGDAASAGVDPLSVAGNQAYDNAYLLYSLPTSLVVVSLVTALFTRMSTNAATGEVGKVRDDTSLALRVVGLFTVFVAPAMMVLSLPMTRILNAAVSYTEVRSISTVLTCMLVGLISVGAWTVLQRVYYAFEAARHLFWIQVPTVVVLAGGAILAMTLPPTWTVPTIGLAMAASNTLGAGLAYAQLRRYVPDLDARRVGGAYLRIAAAAAVPVLVGFVVLRMWGTDSSMDVLGAIVRTLVVGALMVALYVPMLMVLRVQEFQIVLRPALRILAGIGRRIPGPAGRALARLGAKPTQGNTATSGDADGGASPEVPGSGDTLKGATHEMGGDDDVPNPPMKEPLDAVRNENRDAAYARERLAALGLDEDVPLIGGRYLMDNYYDPAPELPGEPAEDLILGRSVRVLRLDPGTPETDAALDAARRAALVRDERLLAMLDVGEDQFDAWIVTEEIPGTGLDDLVSEGPLAIADARAVIGEAATALEAANRLGVHHLALEPQSVRVTREGEVVVIGLGVQAIIAGSPHTHDAANLDVISAARADAIDLVRLAHLTLTGELPPFGETLEGINYPEGTAQPMIDLAQRTLCGGEPPVGPNSIIRAYSPWVQVAPAPEAEGTPKRRRRGSSLFAAAFTKRGEAHAEPEPAEPSEPADAMAPPPPPGYEPVVEDVAQPDAPTEILDVTQLRESLAEQQVGGESLTEEPVVEEPAVEEPAVEEPVDEQLAVAPTVDEHADEHAEEEPPAAEPVVPAQSASPAPPPAPSEPSASPAPPVGEPAEASDEGLDAVAPARLEEVFPFETQAAPSGDVPRKQSRTVFGVIATVVLVALIAAVVLLVRPPIFDSFSRDDAPKPEATAPAPEAQESEPEPLPTAEPVISGLALIDPEQRYPDHAEDLPLAMDGNPRTAWRTLWYNSAAFGNVKPGAGIEVQLTEPSAVSAIVLGVAGEGGNVQVLTAPVGDPDSEVLATSTLGPDMTIALDEPVGLESFVLWFDELPRAKENGRYMIALHELTVR